MKAKRRRIKRGRVLAKAILAFLLFPRPAGARQAQRQTLSVTGSVSGGSGQSLESNVGQLAPSAVSDGMRNAVYSGYVNTDHAPGSVTTLVAVSSGAQNVQLQWTEVGADGFVGQAASLAIKVSTSPITTQSLYDAASTYAVLTPLAPGGFESLILTELSVGGTYFFAMEARDQAKNQGQLSNPAGAGTFGSPPADITTLAALDGLGGGTASLTFLSPGSNGDSGSLNAGQFRIDYSSVAGSSFNFITYQVLIPTSTTAGAAQTAAVAGLLGNATYYFDVFTGNSVPIFSGPSNVASLLTLAYPPVAAAASNVSSASFTANWGFGNDASGTQFYCELSTAPTFSPVLAATGWAASLSAVFAGLSSNTSYYAQVEARNAAGVVTAFTNLGAVSLSNGLNYPTGVIVASGDRVLTLSWNPALSGAPIDTLLYRSSSVSGPFALLATVPLPSVSYRDAGLSDGVTYYYELSESNAGEASALSPVVSGIPLSGVAPQGLLGLAGAFAGGGYALAWEPNPFNTNGTALVDMRGYAIFRATTVVGAAPVEIGFVSSTTLTFADLAVDSAGSPWYFVRVVDTSGNQSTDSLWVHAGAANEHDSVAPDHEAYAQIPGGGLAYLIQQGTALLWTLYPQDDIGRVAASYGLAAVRSDTGLAVPDFTLPTGAEFTFHYSARDPATGGPASNAYTPADLAVFIYNGAQYIDIGGTVDAALGLITAGSQQTGRYQVRASAASNAFAILQTVPAHIFTPNGDGINDTFTVVLNNPNDEPISQARIYDISGGVVADMVLGALGGSVVWNGHDNRGGIAHAGIYIYQIKAQGKVFNGTVVVAR